jgi:hypothetical protein
MDASRYFLDVASTPPSQRVLQNQGHLLDQSRPQYINNSEA